MSGATTYTVTPGSDRKFPCLMPGCHHVRRLRGLCQQHVVEFYAGSKRKKKDWVAKGWILPPAKRGRKKKPVTA